MKFRSPVHLEKAHEPFLESFDCGDPVLNDWLKTKAIPNEEKKASRTYVVFTESGDPAGFFSICANALHHQLMSAASRRNKLDPIPVVLIGRLAVDRKYQGCGLGTAMLDVAVAISRRISDIAGAVFVAVQPISESAAKFYSRNGFKAAKSGGSLLIFRL